MLEMFSILQWLSWKLSWEPSRLFCRCSEALSSQDIMMMLMDAIHGLTCFRKSPHPRHLDQEEFGESPPHTWQVMASLTEFHCILPWQVAVAPSWHPNCRALAVRLFRAAWRKGGKAGGVSGLALGSCKPSDSSLRKRTKSISPSWPQVPRSILYDYMMSFAQRSPKLYRQIKQVSSSVQSSMSTKFFFNHFCAWSGLPQRNWCKSAAPTLLGVKELHRPAISQGRAKSSGFPCLPYSPRLMQFSINFISISPKCRGLNKNSRLQLDGLLHLC